MTPTRLKDLAASAALQRVRSERKINRWLQEQGITDPETRIAVKHQLMAQGLATDDQPPVGTMRTDLSRYSPATTPLGPERDMRALFPLVRVCPHCHQMMPRRWWADDPAEGP
jgi:hypothetical protein